MKANSWEGIAARNRNLVKRVDEISGVLGVTRSVAMPPNKYWRARSIEFGTVMREDELLRCFFQEKVTARVEPVPQAGVDRERYVSFGIDPTDRYQDEIVQILNEAPSRHGWFSRRGAHFRLNVCERLLGDVELALGGETFQAGGLALPTAEEYYPANEQLNVSV